MFLLSKIITAVILPPGSVIAVLLVITLLQFRKSGTRSKVLSGMSILVLSFFYLLCTEPFSEGLMKPLENYSAEFSYSDSNPELIVILGGGGTVRKLKDGTTAGEISSVTRDRLLEGLILRKERSLPVLFTGGNVLKGEGSPGEADGVRDVLERMGLEEGAFLLENESRNTYENALYSAKLTGLRKIILVTSAFHAQRSILCFTNAGFEIVEFQPVDIRIDEKAFSILDLMPTMEALRNSYTALHEYYGLMYYKLRYRL